MKQEIKNINKQLQIVIGKILNKDYFKLEFGCKVEYWVKRYVGRGYSNVYYHGEVLRLLTGGSIEVFVNKLKKPHIIKPSDILHNFEILGQEPTLNDVLLAIKENNGVYAGKWETLLYGNGKIFYELKKSLFNQSEETKLAIIKLLE